MSFQIVKAVKKDTNNEDHEGEEEETLGSSPSSNSHHKLTRLDLTGTALTAKGAETLLRNFKTLAVLRLEQEVWGALLKGVSDESICFDCVGQNPNIKSINCGEVSAYLPALYDLFPSLTHLKINLARMLAVRDQRWAHSWLFCHMKLKVAIALLFLQVAKALD